MDLKRGDTFVVRIVVQDREGNAVDLTGKTIRWTARSATDIPATSVTDDSGAAIAKVVSTFTNPTSGIAEIVLTSRDTDIDPGPYVTDAQYNDGSSVPIVWSSLTTTFNIIPDITRAD